MSQRATVTRAGRVSRVLIRYGESLPTGPEHAATTGSETNRDRAESSEALSDSGEERSVTPTQLSELDVPAAQPRHVSTETEYSNESISDSLLRQLVTPTKNDSPEISGRLHSERSASPDDYGDNDRRNDTTGRDSPWSDGSRGTGMPRTEGRGTDTARAGETSARGRSMSSPPRISASEQVQAANWEPDTIQRVQQNQTEWNSFRERFARGDQVDSLPPVGAEQPDEVQRVRYRVAYQAYKERAARGEPRDSPSPIGRTSGPSDSINVGFNSPKEFHIRTSTALGSPTYIYVPRSKPGPTILVLNTPESGGTKSQTTSTMKDSDLQGLTPTGSQGASLPEQAPTEPNSSKWGTTNERPQPRKKSFGVEDASPSPVSVSASVAPSPAIKQESVTPDLHRENVEEGKEKNQPLTRRRSRSLDSREKTWSGDELPDHVSETDIDSSRIPYEAKGKWKAKSVTFAETPQLNDEPLEDVKPEPAPEAHDFSEIYEQIRKRQERERRKKKDLERRYEELEIRKKVIEDYYAKLEAEEEAALLKAIHESEKEAKEAEEKRKRLAAETDNRKTMPAKTPENAKAGGSKSTGGEATSAKKETKKDRRSSSKSTAETKGESSKSAPKGDGDAPRPTKQEEKPEGGKSKKSEEPIQGASIAEVEAMLKQYVSTQERARTPSAAAQRASRTIPSDSAIRGNSRGRSSTPGPDDSSSTSASRPPREN